MQDTRPIFTVGHSNRPLADFIALLKAHAIGTLIDVRTVPRSRHNPQFNKDSLPGELAAHGISYAHFPGLGGLRHARKDSPNKGWRNESFRGYADYMQTEAFEQNLNTLIEESAKGSVALMCAEAVPWRCHRSLIADALLVRGFGVEEIVDSKRSKPHELTSFARAEGTRVTYPGPQQDLPLEGDS